MRLIDCSRVEGAATIVDAPASVHRFHDVTLVPIGADHKPGLYAPDGGLIREAAYFRGLPAPHFPLEAERLQSGWTPPAAYAPEGPRYLFAGHVTGHYGHFLFAILSRLWSLPHPPPPDVRIVLLNGANAHELFELDFARTLFDALGLTPESFAVFREPVRFREICVPDAAIEENHLGRPQFTALCRRLGDRIVAGRTGAEQDRPVFLTKGSLSRGVHRIVNEDALCSALERRGFRIVSPEQLPFAEQVAIWREAPAICSVFGSMLHTAAFSTGRRYVALNPEPWINSNQAIIDRLIGAQGRIVYPQGGYLSEPAEGFQHGLRVRDPERVARELTRLTRQAAAGPVGVLERLRALVSRPRPRLAPIAPGGHAG